MTWQSLPEPSEVGHQHFLWHTWPGPLVCKHHYWLGGQSCLYWWVYEPPKGDFLPPLNPARMYCTLH